MVFELFPKALLWEGRGCFVGAGGFEGVGELAAAEPHDADEVVSGAERAIGEVIFALAVESWPVMDGHLHDPVAGGGD